MSKGESPIIFSVSSIADIALRTYYLDDRQRQHILLGHRGLAQAGLVAVQTTVEGPTHIYRSKTDDNRFLFVSQNVVMGRGGRPMKVVIERTGETGKIITATWSNNSFSEELVWDSSGALYTNYDEQHDIFYISKGSARLEYSEDDPDYEMLWLRRNDDDNSPQGVTIFGLKRIAGDERDNLFQRIALFLGATKDDIRLRAGVVFSR